MRTPKVSLTRVFCISAVAPSVAAAGLGGVAVADVVCGSMSDPAPVLTSLSCESSDPISMSAAAAPSRLAFSLKPCGQTAEGGSRDARFSDAGRSL